MVLTSNLQGGVPTSSLAESVAGFTPVSTAIGLSSAVHDPEKKEASRRKQHPMTAGVLRSSPNNYPVFEPHDLRFGIARRFAIQRGGLMTGDYCVHRMFRDTRGMLVLMVLVVGRGVVSWNIRKKKPLILII